MTNPYPYTDKAADLVQEASMLQVNMFKQDSDNISIPISHIDGMWWFPQQQKIPGLRDKFSSPNLQTDD